MSDYVPMIANKLEWSNVTKIAVTHEAEICRYYSQLQQIKCNGNILRFQKDQIKLYKDDFMCMLYHDY